MRNRSKLDPQVAKIMKKSAAKTSTKKLDVSLTVGGSVICMARISPKNQGEFFRLQSNRSAEDRDLSAFTATLENDGEGTCSARILCDGKELTFGYLDFGKDVHHAVLRINGKYADKICSPEGLTALLAKEL